MIVTQISHTSAHFPFLAPVHSSFPREEHLLFLDVLPVDPRARYILSNPMTYTYVRSRGCRWARSHQEEVKKRKRARAMRKRIPLRARGLRRCGTIVRCKRRRRRGREREKSRNGSAFGENRVRGNTRMFNASH